MLILEAPGYRELEEGRPLIGPAGKIADSIFATVGIDRTQIRIANSCQCVDMARDDRRPTPAELDSCRPRLLDDITTTNPSLIIAMGNISQQLFFPGTKVGQIRGKFRNWQGRIVLPTYHPAAALPMRNPELKHVIADDIRTALTLI